MWDVRGHENKVFKSHYPSQRMHFPKYHIIMYNLSSFSIISLGISGARLVTLAPSLLSPHVPSFAHNLYSKHIGHSKGTQSHV